MRIEILDRATDDLIEGFGFYETQQSGVGQYFLDSLYGDIDSLRTSASIHRRVHKGYHRLLARRFPYAVYYSVLGDLIQIHAVLDCRRDPAWIARRLEK